MNISIFKLPEIITLFISFCLISASAVAQTPSSIEFGCGIDPAKQILESRNLAKSIANPDDPNWRAKGDLKRKYHFPAANTDIPYRLYIPVSWDGKSRLPMVVFLHGAMSDENRYIDANNRQLIRLAEEHGYILLSPLGYTSMGAYGTPLRLPAVFGNPEAAAKQRASVDEKRKQTLQLSEKDVINVIEIVLNEYPVDRSSIFLAGHSMGSGGTWYLGAKYNQYWRAIAPMSGPFVDETNYPWDNIRKMPVFMTEGTGAKPSLAGSRAMLAWMKERGFKIEYMEVEADHGGMIPLVMPGIFDFFDRNRIAKNAQETIRLWKGKAPGSENWNYQEKTSSFPGGGSIVQNVVDPTMTAYLPDPSIANGSAVIVCPGGAFRMLSLEGEGADVARWLTKQGFAAFVLKYRLYKADDSRGMGPPMDLSKIKLSLKFANANPAPDNHELNNVIRLATADGQRAIRLVRKNAEKWHIDPSKTGIMGFSAGGGVAVGTALLDDPEGRPDFVVSLYGPSMVDVHVPADAPPLFIAVAANHKPVSLGCVALYSVWNEAGKSAELHVFSKGRGPFGIRKQGLPSDAWPDLFLSWIKGEGLI